MDTVVIQETDREIMDVLTLALEMEGFEVHPVIDFDDKFLDIIEEVRPHVVLLDYRLSGEHCIEMCHEIKNRYPHLPVIALSYNNNIQQEYNRKGFDDYIKKPFDLDVLYSILRFHIANST
jgi:DNA-binding response OmpR family regulator